MMIYDEMHHVVQKNTPSASRRVVKIERRKTEKRKSEEINIPCFLNKIPELNTKPWGPFKSGRGVLSSIGDA